CRTVGGPHENVTAEELDALVAGSVADAGLDGQHVVLVIPDGTRSCPLPLLVGTLHRHLSPVVGSLTAVIALGTHSYMEPEEIDRLLGVGGESQPATLEEAYPGLRVVNHEWADPDMLVHVGTIPAARISGGNTSLIPGGASQEFIDMTHWVGALITSTEIIGTTGITPVRAMINEGAAMIPTRRLALCCVVRSGSGDLEAAAFGTPEDAWAATAAIASETHVEWLDEPMQRVIAVMPTRYDDIWTAAKGGYKTEPAIADGGEVVIYAPHVTEVSEVHHEIYEIGYHCRDYFVTQWERFEHIHWGVLAHSTHLRGQGTYDPQTGEERLRIRVTLATGIPREVCE